jgi:predicted Zn-ribbon and HTH transcriptional regulator
MVVAFTNSYPLNYDRIFYLTERALVENGYEIIALDYENGKILGAKGIIASNWKTWGVLIFGVIRGQQKTTQVYLESQRIFSLRKKWDVDPIFYTLNVKVAKKDVIEVEPEKNFTLINKDSKCPSCGYEFTSQSSLKSLNDETVESKCPTCQFKYHSVLTDEMRRNVINPGDSREENITIYKNKKIDTTRITKYGMVLIFISFLNLIIFFSETWLYWLIGLIILIAFIGTILASLRIFKGGSICLNIVGIMLFPMGFIGLLAGNIAWKYSKW